MASPFLCTSGEIVMPAIIAAMADRSCTECPRPLTGVRAGQVRHPEYMRAYKARWVREKRARFAMAAGPEQLESRRRAEARRVADYYHDLPPERAAALGRKWHATCRRDYEATLAVADQRYEPWTDDEDEYVLKDLHVAARVVGIALGRTSYRWSPGGSGCAEGSGWTATSDPRIIAGHAEGGPDRRGQGRDLERAGGRAAPMATRPWWIVRGAPRTRSGGGRCGSTTRMTVRSRR
jgi:hypothetical protein